MACRGSRPKTCVLPEDSANSAQLRVAGVLQDQENAHAGSQTQSRKPYGFSLRVPLRRAISNMIHVPAGRLRSDPAPCFLGRLPDSFKRHIQGTVPLAGYRGLRRDGAGRVTDFGHGRPSANSHRSAIARRSAVPCNFRPSRSTYSRRQSSSAYRHHDARAS